MMALVTSCGPDYAKLLTAPAERQVETITQSWSFRQVGNDEWMPATVPGVVHTDLLANGKIDDPYATTNEPKLQWIEFETWEYRTTFTPSAALMANECQELVFKGLDTYADVYLNDSLVLSGDNMFVEWRIPAKGILRDGENSLRIVFHPAYPIGEELSKKYPKLPADNDKGKIQTSVFTRKAPYHFGWDWGPRFATVGVWRPVQIEGYSTASINNVQYIQTSQSEQMATIDANVTLNGSAAAKVQVMILDSAGNVYGQTDAQVTPGATTTVKVPITITNPRLWWPNGLGDPNLYAMNAVVVSDNGTKLDQNSQNIGIRTVRWIQEKDSVGDGSSFMIEVNGHRIFSKGANYIPQSLFIPSVTRTQYEDMISTAVNSNMNMIRIWGGGIYEEDIFYDLCDSSGIMVWQDFMFACSLYPWDEEFFASVEREAVDNIRRMRNHPSIVIWCGNNEITELWYQWGYQKAYKWTPEEEAVIFKGMKDLFYKLLPDVLAVEDSTRYYHPSSPLYAKGIGNSVTQADIHYWGVFHGEEPFSVYKDKPGRYSNEYGFQSLACYDTYRESFTPEDMQLYSEAMIIHQKNPKGYRVMEEYMVRDLPLLKDDFRTYVYLTQLLQAEGIKIAMEGHRSKRPWTMGSLYWQINDCWPVASWSSMDSKGRWKALQYYAGRSFAPTILSFEKVDSSATAVLWGLNDLLAEQSGTAKLTMIDFTGKEIWSETIEAKLPANGNSELMRRTDAELLKGANPAEVMLVAEGNIGGKDMRSIYYFTPFKDLKLPKADYTVSYKKNGKQVEATIKANNLLKSVLFEAEALQNNPSDAYFDLLPGQERVITLNFVEDKPVEELGISVRVLNSLVGRPSETPVKENVGSKSKPKKAVSSNPI